MFVGSPGILNSLLPELPFSTASRIAYCRHELLVLRNYDVTPARLVRKAIFNSRLWLPGYLRRHQTPIGDFQPSAVCSTASSSLLVSVPLPLNKSLGVRYNVNYCRRGQRSDRRRWSPPSLHSVGNGAFIVRSQRPSFPASSRLRPRSLITVSCLPLNNAATSLKRLVFASLNVRSLTNKVDDLLELRRDRSIDVMSLVETWHDTDSVALRRLRSDGYHVVDRPRPRCQSETDSLSTNHGGVAIVSVPGVRLSMIALKVSPTTFELLCAKASTGSFSCTIVVIYRPGSDAVTPAFFDDLSDVMECVAGHVAPTYIVGDLNIRLDRCDDPNSRRLTNLFDAYGLVLHNTGSTHNLGGRLDVVATRRDLPSPSVSVYDPGLSDHYLLQWSVPVMRPVPAVTTVVRRPWHLLDVTSLKEAILSSRLCQPDYWISRSADELASLYDDTISSLLNASIPARIVTCRRRPSDPWFDQECRLAKRSVRRHERTARANATLESALVWRLKRCEYRSLLRRKRQSFWIKKIDAEKQSPRQLWRSINSLLGRGRTPLTDVIDADQFHKAFDEKVAGVRSTTANASLPSFQTSPSRPSLFEFQPITIDSVVTAVRALPDKSCALDALPTRFLKAAIDVLAPFLTALFNKSLSTGCVPEIFKIAYVTPLLKKSDSDATDVRSYRPISNLSVLSKLLERLVAQQLLLYLNSANLLPSLQSAYRANHSTETAVLKVLSDILLAIDAGNLSVLALLDLSAAFDTVDHEILLQRLNITYGLTGTVLHWFETYLVGRRQYVRFGSSSSSPTFIVCGVPQGSVLGPILFLLYVADVLSLIEGHGLHPHLYADDTQIYGFCPPSASSELQSRISECIDDVAAWMRSNRLQLNTSKSEVLWSSTSRRQHQLPQSSLRVVDDHVTPASVIRDLGIYIDIDVSMTSHVTKTVSACFAVLRQLRTIRRSVSRSVLQSLVVSLVLSRLDYGNATLAGIPAHLMSRLQSVMNAAARLIFSSSKFDSVTQLLRQLHWLKAPERIKYKVAILAYKCVHGMAPSYLSNEFSRPADIEARRRLRSASTSSLIVRRTRLSTVGDRAFPVAAARTWNSLPQHVLSSPSLTVFKSRLKTYLFSFSYP